jgi:hypothetical protein
VSDINLVHDPEGAAFLRDTHIAQGRLSWTMDGYRWMAFTPGPDNDRIAAIQAIEQEVADGILRWLDRQKPGFAYDYWLIYFGVADEEGTGTTETWPQLRTRLWADMDAGLWLDTRDCYGPQDQLWKRAVSIVYAQLFPGRTR